jgi:hypothetical protein
MQAIRVKIVEYLDDGYPGWVECKFTDAWNKEHTIREKAPIVGAEYLNISSEYPKEGVIAFELVRKWRDKDGRIVFTVDMGKPWGIESVEGLSEFDILEDQIIDLAG